MKRDNDDEAPAAIQCRGPRAVERAVQMQRPERARFLSRQWGEAASGRGKQNPRVNRLVAVRLAAPAATSCGVACRVPPALTIVAMAGQRRART